MMSGNKQQQVSRGCANAILIYPREAEPQANAACIGPPNKSVGVLISWSGIRILNKA